MRLLFASTPQPRRGHVPQPRLRTSIATAAAMGADTTTKKIGGAKNGGTRVVPNKKAPGYYPADDVKVKVKGASKPPTPAKLRSSIKPGSVLILLAGRFRGRRVVFLKQLPSGLLLVTGPYAVNGIPVRRVNQAYVIATSTTVDISKVDVSKFEDGYFGKPKVAKKKQKKSSDEFFAEEQPKNELSAERKADQEAVDNALMPKLDDMMKKYLKARFSLSKNQAPHNMKF